MRDRAARQRRVRPTDQLENTLVGWKPTTRAAERSILAANETGNLVSASSHTIRSASVR